MERNREFGQPDAIYTSYEELLKAMREFPSRFTNTELYAKMYESYQTPADAETNNRPDQTTLIA